MKLCVPIAQAATRFDSLDRSTERLACGRGGGSGGSHKTNDTGHTRQAGSVCSIVNIHIWSTVM